MKIWILCAMQDESDLIIEKYSLKKNSDEFFNVYQWEAHWNQIILLQSNIWKVYASAWTVHLIEQYKADEIINIWLAWWIKEEREIWNVYQIKEVIQHDAYVPWDWEHLDYFKWSIELKITEWIEHWTCLTWDQFIDCEIKSKEMSNKWCIVEMELFAVASVCKIFNIPCIWIKAISDNAMSDAKWNFEDNIQKSMINSLETLDKTLLEL